MAQDPPSGVVCSAGVVDICCLFSLSNAITSYGDRYPEGCTEESNFRSMAICGLAMAMPMRDDG